jgi:L-fucose isomerase-like protein
VTSPAVPTLPATVPFALFTAVSAIHDPAALAELVGSFTAPLRALGAVPWTTPAERPAGPLVVFVVTGGTERRVLERADVAAREPVLLVAHPGHNSLPASLEVLGRLQQLGVRGRVHYLRGPGDADGLGSLAASLHDLAVRDALMRSRIGRVGEPSDWLVASSPDADVVRSVWGPTVVPVPLDVLLSEPDARTVEEGDGIARDFRAGALALVEPGDADLRSSGRVLAMLRRVVAAERLDALSVRCFDLVVRRHMTGCLALAQLNDDGVIAGCEGDLVSTVAMLWLHHLLGAIPWMANPSRVDMDRGTLLLAHCTVARGAASGYRLRSHFESGLGVGVQGLLDAGPVTLVRIGGARMERLRALDGMLLRNTDHADLCRTQVEVEVGREALEDQLARPLGNHMVLVPGHHAARLKRWHEAMIG